MTHRVRIMWQNVALALTFLAATTVACVLIMQRAGQAKPVLLAVAIAVGAVLVWRTWRTGVYGTPEGLTIRHTWHTRTIPWRAISGVSLYERTNARGRYYAPAVMCHPITANGIVQDGLTSQVNLWMLATVSRTAAVRMEDRVQQLGRARTGQAGSSV